MQSKVLNIIGIIAVAIAIISAYFITISSPSQGKNPDS